MCFVHKEHFQIYPNRSFVQLVYKEPLCKILGRGAAQHCTRAVILAYPWKLMHLFWLIPVKITCCMIILNAGSYPSKTICKWICRWSSMVTNNMREKSSSYTSLCHDIHNVMLCNVMCGMFQCGMPSILIHMYQCCWGTYCLSSNLNSSTLKMKAADTIKVHNILYQKTALFIISHENLKSHVIGETRV